MFRLICRLVLILQNRYRFLLFFSLLLSLVSVPALFQLEFQFSLLDIFPKDLPARQEALKVQKEFGGFGKLTVIAQSPDSAKNLNLIRDLSAKLQDNPLVNFTEYRTEADFFEKHKLLYIDLKDLEDIRSRISRNILQERSRQHPFIVSLSGDKDYADSPRLILSDLEEKYTGSLQEFLGSADGTTIMLNVFPTFDVGDTRKNLDLLRDIKRLLKVLNADKQVRILYGGAVYESTASEGQMLNELFKTFWISALLLLLALLFFFIRQPRAPFVMLIALANTVLWTLAFASILYGSLNIFTLVLGIILVGLGSDGGIHLLSHYQEERRKRVGPRMAMEHVILETGPAICASTLTSAAAFFALTLVPLEGVSQFGMLAGTGILIAWFNVFVLFPVLFLRLQKQKTWRVYGKRIFHNHEFGIRPFFTWKKTALASVIITGISLSIGVIPQFDYDFRRMGFISSNPEAEDLMEQHNNSYEGIAVILTPDKTETRRLVQHLQQSLDQDTSRTIDRIYHFRSLLPKDQEAKIAILEEINDMLSPEVIAGLDSINRANVEKIMNAWDVEPVTEEDIPYSFRRKFLGRNGRIGEFIFVFPKIDVFNGEECRALARDIRTIQLDDSTTYHATGKPILTAELLNLTLPHMQPPFFWAFGIVFFLLLLFHNRLSAAIFILTPSLIGVIWLLGAMNLLGLKANLYNALLFPVLAGLSIDGTLHLYQRYREEGPGSLYFVMKTTGFSVIFASLTSVIGFAGFLFSSHMGIQSVAKLAVLGLFCILSANLLVFFSIAGWLDARKVQEDS